MNLQTINKIASYLGAKSDNVSCGKDEVLRVNCGGNEHVGLAPVISNLAAQSSDAKFNKEQQYLIYQWIEFASLYGVQLKVNSQQAKLILKEINSYLEESSYLVGYSITLADVVIYHLVYELLDSLSPVERESFLGLCRWFNHIQQEDAVRQSNKMINFSSTYVSSKYTTGY